MGIIITAAADALAPHLIDPLAAGMSQEQLFERLPTISTKPQHA